MEELDETQFRKLEDAGRYFLGRKEGDQATAPVASSCPDANKVEQLWEQQQWLHQQLIEHQGALNAAKDDKPASSDDLENLQLRASDLQKDFLEVETDSSLRDFILQKLQMSSTLSTAFWPSGGYGEEMPEQERIRSCMTELLDKQVELGSAIMRIHKEIQDVKPELARTKQKNLELLQDNRKLMWNIQQIKNSTDSTPKKDDQKLKRLQKVYDETLSKIKMVRHIFQALILSSGINFGADQAMMDLMISLGMPLEKQLEKL